MREDQCRFHLSLLTGLPELVGVTKCKTEQEMVKEEEEHNTPPSYRGIWKGKSQQNQLWMKQTWTGSKIFANEGSNAHLKSFQTRHRAMYQESTTFFLWRGLWPLVWPFVLPLSSFWDNWGASWVTAERKLRDCRQDFLHMWRAFVESNMQEQTLTCLVYWPPFMILLDNPNPLCRR